MPKKAPVKITGDRRFGIAGGFAGGSYSTISRAQWMGSAEKREGESRCPCWRISGFGLASGLIIYYRFVIPLCRMVM